MLKHLDKIINVFVLIWRPNIYFYFRYNQRGLCSILIPYIIAPWSSFDSIFHQILDPPSFCSQFQTIETNAPPWPKHLKNFVKSPQKTSVEKEISVYYKNKRYAKAKGMDFSKTERMILHLFHQLSFLISFLYFIYRM